MRWQLTGLRATSPSYYGMWLNGELGRLFTSPPLEVVAGSWPQQRGRDSTRASIAVTRRGWQCRIRAPDSRTQLRRLE
jgi:hypothetical protein